MTRSDFSMLTARLGSFYIKYLRRSHDPGTPRLPRGVLHFAAAATVVVGAVIGGHFTPPPPPQLSAAPSKEERSSTYCAPFGDHKTVALPDGSSLVLNSATCVSTAFSKKDRRLRLDLGEAIFKVAHDANRPFVVESGRVSVTDVGTRFSIYTREKVGVRVAVFEGAVKIAPRGTAARRNDVSVVAGQQIDIPNDMGVSLISHITSRDIERMTAWVDGFVQLRGGEPLGEVLAELQRYQHFSYKTMDRQILNQEMGGRFRTNNIDGFIADLARLCIRGEHHESDGNVTLTRITGKPQAHCP